jgi:hypothetical protein
MDAAPPQHAPAGAPLGAPPSVANENRKRMLPPCTAAPDPMQRSSAARKRSRHVELAHGNDRTATAGEGVLHHQNLALVEARSVAGTPYAEPTDAQLAAQMQQMQEQMQQMLQQMQEKMLQQM